MHYCAQGNHVAFAEYLIKRGASVEAAERHGWRPLHIAAANGCNEICELLLRAGAEVNATESLQWTPLMLAAQDGHTSTCQLLLDWGADINNLDRAGRTALSICAHSNFPDTINLLIQSGADVNSATKKNKYTALFYAATRGHKEVVLTLLQNGATLGTCDTYSPILELAIKRGHADVVQLLLSKGAIIRKELRAIPDEETFIELLQRVPQITQYQVEIDLSLNATRLGRVIRNNAHVERIGRVGKISGGDITVLLQALRQNFTLLNFDIG